MERLDEQDVVRVKDLLRRTGEFIAYFELAESKMISWRQDLEQKANAHERQFGEQLKALQLELNALEEIFTTAGLSKFRLAADNALKEGQDCLNEMIATKTSLLKELAAEKKNLAMQCEQMLTKLDEHTAQAVAAIDAQLKQYDGQAFEKAAHESCQEIKRITSKTIEAGTQLLKKFHWRTITIAIITTLLTSFTLGLYMSDEYPWEIHKNAMNERGAGKLLMSAWPKLSYQEKVKILGEQGAGKV